MKVVINADDFGHDASTSDAIMQAFCSGYITQATLMTNMLDCERAANEAKAAGFGGRIGLHINITDGIPLTEPIRSSRAFCDSSGKFDGSAVLRKRHFLPYPISDASALAIEIEAQVKKYISLGLTLLHADSHHHAHTRLPIARVVMPILAKYGFRSVRRPYSHNLPMSIGGQLRRLRSHLFLREARKSKLIVARGFGGALYSSCTMLSETNFEIMVHPRFYGGLLVDTSDFDTGRGRELVECVAFLKSLGADFVTYRNL